MKLILSVIISGPPPVLGVFTSRPFYRVLKREIVKLVIYFQRLGPNVKVGKH